MTARFIYLKTTTYNTRFMAIFQNNQVSRYQNATLRMS